MNGYEKLIKTIRSESSRSDKPLELKLAIMTSPTSCSLGQLELDSDDLYIAEHLTEKALINLDLKINSSGGTSHSHTITDKSEYISPLEEGDLVVIAKVSNDKYAIITKLVEV